MTAPVDKVVAQAGRSVVPTEADRRRTDKVAEKVLSAVMEAAVSHREVVGVFLGGSYAKDTWLPRDVDIDVFVKVATEVDEKRFEEVGLAVGREALRGYKPGKKYAQHPYTEATVDGFKVNVVPCYDAKPGEWKSAADRSLHHVDFVRVHLDEDGRLQVRLLKRFMKGVGVYGAEIENEGFSGYATEVLVYENKTFERALIAFSQFVPKSKEHYFRLFDPIDGARDLGKAISRESVARMVLASRAFLDRPSIRFFKGVSGKERPALRERVYAIVFDHKELSEDTLWGELKRSARQVAKHVREEGFPLARVEAASDNWGSSAIMVLPLGETLSDLEERPGPPVELEDGARRFASRNRKSAQLVWVGEDGRLRVIARRRFTSLGEFLEEVVRSRGERIGVSKEVGAALKKNGRVLHGTKLMREADRKAWLADGISRIVSDSVGV
ncbi:MAG TPA: CCA tRNA nucleotidyltransferase [Nitrososphaerales archaeon]|nr:CCA tRNA nucleotidyltransferase [Nitrososphaerales archaeon]